MCTYMYIIHTHIPPAAREEWRRCHGRHSFRSRVSSTTHTHTHYIHAIPTLAFTRYCFILKVYCGSLSSLYCPAPTCNAYPFAMLLHDYWTLYKPPLTSLLYALHHSTLVITISCKGQYIPHTHTFTHIHTTHPPKHTHAHHTHTRARTHTHTRAHAHTRARARAHTHTQQIHTYTHHTHTHKYTHTQQIYTHTPYTYTHMHTHNTHTGVWQFWHCVMHHLCLLLL